MRIFTFFCCWCLLGSLVAQAQFPQSWEGHYKGKLEIYGVDSVHMKIDMELKITRTQQDSIFDWQLIYNSSRGKDVRAYSLMVVDATKGHFKIDENNSIVLDGYLKNGNIFTSFFEVSNSYILATYTKLEDDFIQFEIISGQGTPVSTTGNSTKDQEQIPLVHSYLVNARQKAILRKE